MSAEPLPAPSTTPPPAADSHKPVVLAPRQAVWLVAIAGAVVGLGALLLFQDQRPEWQDLSRLRFPLQPLLVPRDTLAVPAGPEYFPPLDQPRLLAPAEVAGFRLGEGKYLVPGDRVIGVVVNGEACAFPVRVMEWHEVYNGELGGVPLAVTYGALAECARAFDRRVGGESLELRPSGAVCNMGALLFDRRAREADSSLWAQLDGRAVAGPAAGRGASLRPIPAELVPWGAWQAAHPDSRVLAPDLRVGKLYKRNPYAVYMGRDMLPFPVHPLPPPGLGLKARVLAVEAGGERRVYAVERVAAHAGQTGRWEVAQGAARLRFEVVHDPAGVQPDGLRVALDGPGELLAVPALWFAWHASHPQDPLAD